MLTHQQRLICCILSALVATSLTWQSAYAKSSNTSTSGSQSQAKKQSQTPQPSKPTTQARNVVSTGTSTARIESFQGGSRPWSSSPRSSVGGSSGQGSGPAEPCTDPNPLAACHQFAYIPITDPATPANPEEVARQAVLQLTVPAPGLVIRPDPNANKWKMMPIGLPLWAGNTSPAQPITTTTTQQGITITITANPTTTDVNWGDGTTITCHTMTVRRPGLDPYAESPDCGHTYQTPDDYTVTATTHWNATWTALGQTGTVPLTSTTSVELPIGEIVTVLVPER